MRQLQLMAFGEPSDVIQLNTVAERALGPEDVLVSIEAAPRPWSNETARSEADGRSNNLKRRQEAWLRIR